MNLLANTAIAAMLFAAIGAFAFAEGPFQTTGIKIGEVTQTTAFVWTRLTRDGERVSDAAPLPVVRYLDPDTRALVPESELRGRDWTPEVSFPENANIESIAGAVPGAPGEVRAGYQAAGQSTWAWTDWISVDPARDFTGQFELSNLQPATAYNLRIESRSPGGEVGETVDGAFRTAPEAETPARVRFTVSACQRYIRQDAPGGGFRIYDAMTKLDPDFFVHTGDIVYYDDLGKSDALARWHWQRMYSLPTNVRFHQNIASYFIKDDHDTWMDDCWPGMVSPYMGAFTFAQGQAIFLEQVPMGETTFRTVRWGKDLQIWLVEGRDFRSPNTMPDGPEKTIWGAEQMDWFKRTVTESDATFRMLISPTPVVGPDRPNKRDNHSNEVFAHEGRALRAFLASQPNMVVICGDRHWQYVSVDDETGLREYSCGPASDEHAGGWQQDNVLPEHRYLNVIGGFLAVEVGRESETPFAAFRHYSVDGELLHEDRIESIREN